MFICSLFRHLIIIADQDNKKAPLIQSLSIFIFLNSKIAHELRINVYCYSHFEVHKKLCGEEKGGVSPEVYII